MVKPLDVGLYTFKVLSIKEGSCFSLSNEYSESFQRCKCCNFYFSNFLSYFVVHVFTFHLMSFFHPFSPLFLVWLCLQHSFVCPRMSSIFVLVFSFLEFPMFPFCCLLFRRPSFVAWVFGLWGFEGDFMKSLLLFIHFVSCIAAPLDELLTAKLYFSCGKKKCLSLNLTNMSLFWLFLPPCGFIPHGSISKVAWGVLSWKWTGCPNLFLCLTSCLARSAMSSLKQLQSKTELLLFVMLVAANTGWSQQPQAETRRRLLRSNSTPPDYSIFNHVVFNSSWHW